MTGTASDGTLLWDPTAERRWDPEMTLRVDWHSGEKGLSFAHYGDAGYEELWEPSVRDPECFWNSAWECRGVLHSEPYERVLAKSAMPGAGWFSGAPRLRRERLWRSRGHGSPRPSHHPARFRRK